jgi:hypothetical protein
MEGAKSKWSPWNRWMSGWIEIAQGLAKVLTLGRRRIAWDLKYVRRVARRK